MSGLYINNNTCLENNNAGIGISITQSDNIDLFKSIISNNKGGSAGGVYLKNINNCNISSVYIVSNFAYKLVGGI